MRFIAFDIFDCAAGCRASSVKCPFDQLLLSAWKSGAFEERKESRTWRETRDGRFRNLLFEIVPFKITTQKRVSIEALLLQNE